MLGTFSSVAPYLKFNPKRVTIDNIVFKLHYRWTFILLLVATILVTSRQYIGEHIKCISDTIPVNVINTYCFFTSTFTVVNQFNNTKQMGTAHQLGIGPMQKDEPVRHHAYYQWVPFVLFGQAICFYLPHLLWKSWEGGRIKGLVFGLRMTGLTRYLKEKSLKIGSLNVPSVEEAESKVRNIRRTMIDRMRLNQSWGAHLAFAEVLNLLNLLVQIYATQRFLGGHFYTLGPKILSARTSQQTIDSLNTVFPKMTKCIFHKYGPSGSIQTHDTLCVMALNIINEKIYSVLWFWYVFLLAATVLGLVWRILTLFFYRNYNFSKYVFYWVKPSKLDDDELKAVIQKCNFSNWMFLFFLKANLSEYLYRKVIMHLASDFPDPTDSDNNYNAQIDQAHGADPSRMQTMRIDEVDAPLLKDKSMLKSE